MELNQNTSEHLKDTQRQRSYYFAWKFKHEKAIFERVLRLPTVNELLLRAVVSITEI